MYGRLINILNEDEISSVDNISDLYNQLYDDYVTLQDLNTVEHGQGMDVMDNADFQGIKNQVASGVTVDDALLSVLPASMVNHTKLVLSKYKNEIEDIFNKSKDINQFVYSLDNELPEIIKGEFNGQEYTLKDLNENIENGGI